MQLHNPSNAFYPFYVLSNWDNLAESASQRIEFVSFITYTVQHISDATVIQKFLALAIKPTVHKGELLLNHFSFSGRESYLS